MTSLRIDHVTRSLETEEARKKADHAQDQLEQVKGQLEECLVSAVALGEVRDLVRCVECVMWCEKCV